MRNTLLSAAAVQNAASAPVHTGAGHAVAATPGNAADAFGAVLAQLQLVRGASSADMMQGQDLQGMDLQSPAPPIGQQQIVQSQNPPALLALLTGANLTGKNSPAGKVKADAQTSNPQPPAKDEAKADEANAGSALATLAALTPPLQPDPAPAAATPVASGQVNLDVSAAPAQGSAGVRPQALPASLSAMPALKQADAIAPGDDDGNVEGNAPAPATAAAMNSSFASLIASAKPSVPGSAPQTAAAAPAPAMAQSNAPAPQAPSATVPPPPQSYFAQQDGNSSGGGANSGERGMTDRAAAAPVKANIVDMAFQPQSPDAATAAASVQAATPAPAAPIALQVQAATPASASAKTVPLSDLGLVALNIAAQFKNGTKQFDIALHPAELGSIQVHLNVDTSGAAQAHLTAENPQTLQLLQQDAPQLAQALKDAGLNLTGGGLNFSLKGEQQQNSGNQAPRMAARSLALAVTAVESSAANAYSSTRTSAGVDIQV